MTEVAAESQQPTYKQELSNFNKETLKKIEEFRAARNKWIATNSNQIIDKSKNEGSYKSDEYKGRCTFLRRIRFKTTLLRFHHKTLRPLKFYTCKRKISDTEIEKLINKSLEKSKIRTRKYEKLAGDEHLKKSGKKRKSKKGSKNENFAAKKIGKKASKNLKAPKLESRLIDSCKCEGKKGLTVVIKGVCLCDKTTLNKLTLGEVCSGYSKLEHKKTESAEKKLSHATDSLEIYKKKSSNPLEKIKEEKESAVTLQESLLKKQVKFKQQNKNTENQKLHTQEFAKKNTENDKLHTEQFAKKNTENDKLHSQEFAKKNTEVTKSPQTEKSYIKKESKENTAREKENSSTDNNNILKSHSQKTVIPEQKEVTKENLKASELKIETGDNESAVTLYKNTEQEQSYLNLTKEQEEKMKKILEQNDKKK